MSVRTRGVGGDPATARVRCGVEAGVRGVLALALVWSTATACDAGRAAEREPRLGEIRFPTSGAAAAQPAFRRGVLALHNFWYEEARRAFRQARSIDRGFAMAYWGEALTHHRPLGGDHDRRGGRAVLRALGDAQRAGHVRLTAREAGYIAAARVLFGDGDRRYRLRRYEEALRALVERYPDDDEAAAFYALAVLDNHVHRRGLHRDRILDAAARLERILRRNPEHPGAAHYLIHAYDAPELAARGLSVAERYLEIAPDAPHAVHMPAHIHRHLGEWGKVAEHCERAYALSAEWTERAALPASYRDFHSLRCLHTAYLRLGRYEAARELQRHLRELAAELPDARHAVRPVLRSLQRDRLRTR